MSNWAMQILDSLGTNKGKVSSDGSLFISGQPAAAGTAFSEATASKFMVVDHEGEPLHFDSEGAVKVSPHAVLFHDPVDGAQVVPDHRLWSWTGTTMTVAQNTAPSRITLNAASITTVNTNQTLTSLAQFATYRNGVVNFYGIVQPTNLPNTNAQADLGFGTASAATTPTDGAYFRWKSNNTFVCVVSFNGTEQESSAQVAPSPSVFSVMEIYWSAEKAVFEWTGSDAVEYEVTLSAATSQSSLTNVIRQPLFARVINTAIAPGAAPILELGEMLVLQNTLTFNEQLDDIVTTQLGRGLFQSPLSAFAQTANHANSTSPTSATLSNTAAGYTTLGGRFQFAAVVGAATDFALFGFQVPAGYKACITGIRIDTVLTGAAIATTATILDWSLAVNSTAVSLATVDSVPGAGPVTVAPRRIPLGVQGYALVAPNGPRQIGESAEQITVRFDPPLTAEPGRFIHVIVQVPVGTATASQIFRGDVMLTGYFK